MQNLMRTFLVNLFAPCRNGSDEVHRSSPSRGFYDSLFSQEQQKRVNCTVSERLTLQPSTKIYMSGVTPAPIGSYARIYVPFSALLFLSWLLQQSNDRNLYLITAYLIQKFSFCGTVINIYPCTNIYLECIWGMLR